MHTVSMKNVVYFIATRARLKSLCSCQ